MGRSAAELLLARVNEGRAKWIVPLWAEHGASMALVRHKVDSLEVTWKVRRPEGYSFYLLHRGETPDTAAVQRADAIARALAAFFDAATGSRMRLVPAHGGL